MTPMAYEFMRKVFIKGSVPITDAVPLAIVTNMHHDALLDVDENRYVMTLKGKQEFVQYMVTRAIANQEKELSDIYIEFRLTEHGSGDNPFAVSNELARTLFQIMITSKHLANSEVERGYDYEVFDFINPVTKEQYLMFPGDAIVYSPEHGYVVHNFRKDV